MQARRIQHPVQRAKTGPRPHPRAPPPPPASKPGRLPPYPYHKTNLQPASIYDEAASITTSLYQQIGSSRRAAERRARLLAAAAKLDQA